MKYFQKRLIVAPTLVILSIAALFILFGKRPLPDLTISDVQMVSNQYLTSISYSVTVKNIGETFVSLDQSNEDMISGLKIGVLFTNDKDHPEIGKQRGSILYSIRGNQEKLEPGQSLTDTIFVIKPKILNEGEFACLIVDPENRLNEMDEENNISCAPLYIDGEKEDMSHRELVHIAEYLDHFTYEFPEGVYLGVPPDGKSWTLASYEDACQLKNKVILLENGTLLGPVSGVPYAFKYIDDDLYWLTTNQFGEYGGSVSFLLYVLNIKNNTLSEAYPLANTFAEDGFYDYQDGEFLNDSTFQFRHYWNDEFFKADSAFGTIIIR
jgi:hypothetical protein